MCFDHDSKNKISKLHKRSIHSRHNIYSYILVAKSVVKTCRSMESLLHIVIIVGTWRRKEYREKKQKTEERG